MKTSLFSEVPTVLCIYTSYVVFCTHKLNKTLKIFSPQKRLDYQGSNALSISAFLICMELIVLAFISSKA